MAENKLHVRGHYSEKEINDKLEWAISLLYELVVSIDDIGLVGYTLDKAERINAAIANARRALGLPDPPKLTRECCNEKCGWTGYTDRMCGSVGPLCPDCGEVTEPA